MGFAEYLGQYLYSTDVNGNTNKHSHHLFCVGHSEEKKGRKKNKGLHLEMQFSRSHSGHSWNSVGPSHYYIHL